MLIRINIYGCSWTHGVPNVNRNSSWPEYLSQLLPSDVYIRNFSFCGSSLDYSIYQLHKYKGSSTKEINILQVTSPCRFCIWDERRFTEKQMISVSSNHSKFDYVNNDRSMMRLMAGTICEYRKQRAWFETSINYLDVQSRNLYTQRISNVFYAVSHCDYVFTHLYDEDLTEFNLPCVESVYPKTVYSEDSGFHYGEKGSRLVAEMVYRGIEDRLRVLQETL